jgi:hypothetical protein
MHGPALGAAGLIFEDRLSRILFSSSFGAIDDSHPWGTHPFTDRLLSTERTQFIHYGGEAIRFEKTVTIAQSMVALQNLHVCWADESETNCGRCEKCVRTMVTLEILGALADATCFPAGSLLEKLASVRTRGETAIFFFKELEAIAQQRQRPEIAGAIAACLTRNSRLNASEARLNFFRQLERRIRQARKGLFK